MFFCPSKPPPSLTISLATPLAALGAGTAIALLKGRFGRSLRRLINKIDPIQPTEQQVFDAINRSRSGDENDIMLTPSRVEQYIKEAAEMPVVAGAERKIYWADGYEHKKTRYAVVFLHGWGACRQECRPVPQNVASAIGANLYCGRLPGHGRRHRRGRLGGGGPDGETLVDEANPRALLQSAVDAMCIGLAIGEEVILMGMSTGGVLVTWLASLPSLQAHIAGVVLISPAYALGHPLYPVLKHSFATLRLLPGNIGRRLRSWLISAIIGETKASPALSEEHQRFNSLVYPSAALLNLLDVLWTLDAIGFNYVAAPSIMFGNPNDHVTNFRVKAINAFLRFGETSKALHCITKAEHPHVIASEILSPSTVDEISDAAILFVKTHIVPSKYYVGTQDIAPPSIMSGRIRSMPSGMGSFASYSSLKDLKRPFEA